MFVIINPTKGPWWGGSGEYYVVGEDPHTYPTLPDAQENRDEYAEEYENPELQVYALVEPGKLQALLDIAGAALAENDGDAAEVELPAWIEEKQRLFEQEGDEECPTETP